MTSILTRQIVNSARGLLPNYKALVRKNSRFRIAISRWKKSLKAERYDKFIEMRIAMEALFLSNSRRGSKSDRMAIHSAKFLEPNPNKRQQFCKKIRNFYDTSSEIIHAENPARIDFDRGDLGFIQSNFKTAALMMINNGNIPDWEQEVLN